MLKICCDRMTEHWWVRKVLTSRRNFRDQRGDKIESSRFHLAFACHRQDSSEGTRSDPWPLREEVPKWVRFDR